MIQTGATHVRHNGMDLTPVTADDTTVTLAYDNDVTTAHMIALIEASKSCKQNVQLDCQNVRIYNHATAVADTYWFNRDGAARGNWGTASGVKGCQCLYDGGR